MRFPADCDMAAWYYVKTVFVFWVKGRRCLPLLFYLFYIRCSHTNSAINHFTKKKKIDRIVLTKKFAFECDIEESERNYE